MGLSWFGKEEKERADFASPEYEAATLWVKMNSAKVRLGLYIGIQR